MRSNFLGWSWARVGLGLGRESGFGGEGGVLRPVLDAIGGGEVSPEARGFLPEVVGLENVAEVAAKVYDFLAQYAFMFFASSLLWEC